MKAFAIIALFALAAVTTMTASSARADSGSLCEQNPDAPMCRYF